jgi:hypothetical protein
VSWSDMFLNSLLMITLSFVVMDYIG